MRVFAPLKKLREKVSTHRAGQVLKQLSTNYKIPGTDIYHTPDAPAVEAKDACFVFIYDDMMRHRPQHGKIEYYVKEYGGRGITDINVEAYVNEETGQVAVFPPFGRKTPLPLWGKVNGHAQPSPIKGDLFLVEPSAIFALDKMLQNGLLCDRVEVTVTSWLKKNYFSLLYGREHVTPENPRRRRAWMYLTKPEKSEVDGGYSGWRPMSNFPPNKREKDRPIYFHSYRSRQLAT